VSALSESGMGRLRWAGVGGGGCFCRHEEVAVLLSKSGGDGRHGEVIDWPSGVNGEGWDGQLAASPSSGGGGGGVDLGGVQVASSGEGGSGCTAQIVKCFHS
jgi:hypothetical protein